MSGRQTTILVVDDQLQSREVILRAMEGGFDTSTFSSIEQAEALLLDADMLLIGLDNPDHNTFALIRNLRRDYPRLGLIVMTENDNKAARIATLEAGADDLIDKPFNVGELTARVRSVLRRISDKNQPSTLIRFLDVEIDIESQQVTRAGERLSLTGHEFRLLSVLANQPERVFTREELSRLVSDKAWHPNDRSIDVLVSKLRKKVENTSRPIIRSLRGVGYQFAAHIERTG